MAYTYNIKTCKGLEKVIKEAIHDDMLQVRCVMSGRYGLHIFYTHPNTITKLNEVYIHCSGIGYLYDEKVEKILCDMRLSIYFPLLESVDKL